MNKHEIYPEPFYLNLDDAVFDVNMLTQLLEFVADNIGGRGSGPNIDIFYCEFCKNSNVSCSDICHHPQCMITLIGEKLKQVAKG